MTALVTRRQLLLGAAATGVLAACGGGSSDDGDGVATRTVTTDNGPMEVPAKPKRVVAAIGSFETDMVAVGVMPVLTTTFAGPWVELDDSVVITENIPPTAEELAEVEPDLLVGWNWVTEEASFDTIRDVAPYAGLGETEATAGTLLDPGPMRSWGTLFLSVCDVVGKRAEGERLVEELEARIDSLAERRAGAPPLRVARVEFFDSGAFSFRGQNEDTAELMRRIGIEVVGPETSEEEVSLERLPDIDADLIVVPVGGSMPESVWNDIRETELWKRIPAVQAGKVEVVDGELWPGLGYLWASALLDDLERLFVPA